MILLISCFKVLQQSHIKLVTLGSFLISFYPYKSIPYDMPHVFKYPGGNSPSFMWEMKAKLAKTMCVKYDL